MSSASSATYLIVAQADGSSTALITFAIYTLVVFALAWFSHRMLAGRKFMSEYFLGSRGLGFMALALTYGATSASAGSFTGFPSLIYTYGWVLALWIASYMLVPLCGMGLLGKRINQIARRTGAITLPDLLRERFQSLPLAILSGALLIFLLSFYLIPQFKAGSLILERLLGSMPLYSNASALLADGVRNVPLLREAEPTYLLGLLLFGVMVIAYTTYGGFRAVVWTDMLQGLVMLVGVLLMLGMTLWQVGGLASATSRMAQMTPPELGYIAFQADVAVKESMIIPADIWVSVAPSDAEPPRLVRTNGQATIKAGQRWSNTVKAVQITTPEEIARISRQWPDGEPPPIAGVSPHVASAVSFEDYRHGAGQTGQYVSAPGPHSSKQEGFLPLGLAVSFFVFWAISGTGQPSNMLRLMAFDSSRTLKRAIASLSVYFAMIYFPLVIIFCCARVLEPGLDHEPDRIMPKMAFSLTGAAGQPWLAGLIIAAPFAAAMSTVDSFLLMISSAVVRDVYQRNINPQASERTIKVMSYCCTLVIGVIAMLGAVKSGRFLQAIIVFVGGALAASFLMPVALGLYWRRFNAAGAIASMLSGFSIYLLLQLRGWTPLGLDRLIWGIAASSVAGVVVALLTPPPPADLVRRFFYADVGTHGTRASSASDE